ncbi:MAG: glycosyltransferase family 2 protein [Pseudomonadota bacterium]
MNSTAILNDIKKISLIVPFFNEQLNVNYFLGKVKEVLFSLKERYVFEIITINDGSRDNTLDELLKYKSIHPEIKIIDFSRNFGKEAAITAGIDFAEGDAVIPIDSDLQHPPETILKMIEQWELGFEVVLAKRVDRLTDHGAQKLSAKAFYEVSKAISQIDIPADVGDFRLMDRQVVNALKQMQEKCRFMKGIFAWVGFKTTIVEYKVETRKYGKSSFNLWKLWNFALDGITSFSTIPLRVWTYIGSAISLLALIYSIYLVIKTFILGIDMPGYASLMVAILFLSGVQLIGIGVLGEYIGRIFIEVKNRPIYIIKNLY